MNPGKTLMPQANVYERRHDLAGQAATRWDYAFPVALVQTSGSAGDKTTACSFVYTINDLDGNQLKTAVDPTASPHTYARTSLGKYVAATFGLACILKDGSLSVRWCNEVVDVVANCS